MPCGGSRQGAAASFEHLGRRSEGRRVPEHKVDLLKSSKVRRCASVCSVAQRPVVQRIAEAPVPKACVLWLGQAAVPIDTGVPSLHLTPYCVARCLRLSPPQASMRLENVVGWYHSHPGYGCWLSGIDVGTQMTNQKYQVGAGQRSAGQGRWGQGRAGQGLTKNCP